MLHIALLILAIGALAVRAVLVPDDRLGWGGLALLAAAHLL